MPTFGPSRNSRKPSMTMMMMNDENIITNNNSTTEIATVITPPQGEENDYNSNLAELQETVSRISAHKGIESVVIWKNEGPRGDIVYSSSNSNNNGSPQTDAKKAAAAQRLLKAAEEYFGNTEGTVSFVQVKSTTGKELYISPDQGFVLAVAKR